LAEDDALPVARHEPAEHATHDADATKAVPPPEKVPTGHGFADDEPVPCGQKKPAGQSVCCLLAVSDEQ